MKGLFLTGPYGKYFRGCLAPSTRVEGEYTIVGGQPVETSLQRLQALHGVVVADDIVPGVFVDHFPRNPAFFQLFQQDSQPDSSASLVVTSLRSGVHTVK